MRKDLELPGEVLTYFGTVATALIGEDTLGQSRPEWGANRNARHTYERALRFDRQSSKLEQYNDLKEIGSDTMAKWFAAKLLRLMGEERRRRSHQGRDLRTHRGSDRVVREQGEKALPQGREG
jgi:hypothetical protein